MLVCLISDIHGNLPAFELVLNKSKDVDLFISLGDVVNYGPWSNECVDLLEIIDNKLLLIGNHEINFQTNHYLGDNLIAKTFHDFCIENFNRYKEIANYLLEFSISGYKLIHTIDDKIIFSDTDLLVNQNTIIGHSHKQFISHKGNYLVINPGSVGQNRTYINVVNFMLWDTEKDVFESISFKYDVNVVINKMISLNYPEICINYYKSKKRA